MKESDLWPVLRDYWHPVAFSEEVSDRPVPIELLDERIAVCRLKGQVRAFHDLCIHRGTPISLGWVEGEHIVCAYHGWAYRRDGKCVRIPSLPSEHPIPKKACLTAYPAEERFGLIWVCLSGAPRAAIPECPEFDDPSFQPFLMQRKRWKGSAARVMENFLDQSHFAWVHEGILGDRSHPIAPEMELERNAETFVCSFENIPTPIAPFPHRQTYHVHLPFCCHMLKAEHGTRAKVLYVVGLPHASRVSTRFLIGLRNYDLEQPDIANGPVHVLEDDVRGDAGDPVVQEVVRSHEIVYEQDVVIVEQQRPEELPLDLTEELHVKTPDAAAIEYRRMLKEIGLEG